MTPTPACGSAPGVLASPNAGTAVGTTAATSVTCGGARTKLAAAASLPGRGRLAHDHVLAESQEEYAGRTWTVARWLRYQLTTRKAIRPTALRGYTQHVDAYLLPALGSSAWRR